MPAPGGTLQDAVDRAKLTAEVAELHKKVADTEASASTVEAPDGPHEARGD
jgi:hypothetical protein